MKPIVRAPHPVLTAPAKTVTAFDKRLGRLIANLKSTLLVTKNPKGVGLAAPQVGEPWRVFVTRPRESDPIRVFINPEITKVSDEVTDGVPERGNKLEGCLSIPTVWGRVIRSKTVTLTYQDEAGKPHTESLSGFLATIIQHETDHTKGILFTHRVLEQKGKLYHTTKDTDGKEILEEMELK